MHVRAVKSVKAVLRYVAHARSTIFALKRLSPAASTASDVPLNTALPSRHQPSSVRRTSLQAVDGGVEAALGDHGGNYTVCVEKQVLAVLRVHQGGMQSINGCCCNCVRLLASGSIACITTCEPQDTIT